MARTKAYSRFIPAGAGNTLSTAILFHSAAVYPRWRGEHYSADVVITWYSGLSPLARGTPARLAAVV